MLSSGPRASAVALGSQGVRMWRAFMHFAQARLQGHAFGDLGEPHVFMGSHSHSVGQGSAGGIRIPPLVSVARFVVKA